MQTIHIATPTSNGNGRDQKRVARKLLSELAFALAGTSVSALMAPPRGAKGLKAAHERVLFRKAATLSDADIRKLVAEIGADRILDALTAPKPVLVATE